jgi:hypothetical protein
MEKIEVYSNSWGERRLPFKATNSLSKVNWADLVTSENARSEQGLVGHRPSPRHARHASLSDNMALDTRMNNMTCGISPSLIEIVWEVCQPLN